MTMNIHDKTAAGRETTTPKGAYGARRWLAAGA